MSQENLTPDQLRYSAATLRRMAAQTREGAGYADRCQAMQDDLELAAGYERRANEMEARAIEMESGGCPAAALA